MSYNNQLWTVYLHTVPKNISGYDYDKYYVGITSHKDVNLRWQNGRGYSRKDKNGNYPHFYSAILKYGWNNIIHEILESNLSKSEACEKEKYYIKLYNSNNKLYGYNKTSGGESGYEITNDTKEKMSKNHANFRYGNSPIARKVICLNTLEVFDSLASAAKKYNKTPKDISNVIYKKQKSAGIDMRTGQSLIWDFYDSNKSYRRIIYYNNAPRYKDTRVITHDHKTPFKTITEARDYYHIDRNYILDCLNGKVTYEETLKNEKPYFMWYEKYALSSYFFHDSPLNNICESEDNHYE